MNAPHGQLLLIMLVKVLQTDGRKLIQMLNLIRVCANLCVFNMQQVMGVAYFHQLRAAFGEVVQLTQKMPMTKD